MFFVANPKGWILYALEFVAFSFLFFGALLDLTTRIKNIIYSKFGKAIKVIVVFVFGGLFAYISSVAADWMINDITHLSGKDFPALFALLSAWMTPLLWALLIQIALLIFSAIQFFALAVGYFFTMVTEQFFGAFKPKFFHKLKCNTYRLRYGKRPDESKMFLETIGAIASPIGVFLIVFGLSLVTGFFMAGNPAMKNSLAKFVVFSEYHSNTDCANIKGSVKIRSLDGDRISVASYDLNGSLKFQSMACEPSSSK
jgi:hypothetical protein